MEKHLECVHKQWRSGMAILTGLAVENNTYTDRQHEQAGNSHPINLSFSSSSWASSAAAVRFDQLSYPKEGGRVYTSASPS